MIYRSKELVLNVFSFSLEYTEILLQVLEGPLSLSFLVKNYRTLDNVSLLRLNLCFHSDSIHKFTSYKLHRKYSYPIFL